MGTTHYVDFHDDDHVPRYHDDERSEFVHYVLNDDGSSDLDCDDDDCGRDHVYLLTATQLAARDNGNYDAGYRAASEEHAPF